MTRGLPAISAAQLGDFDTVVIDRAVIPYLLGAIEPLTDPSRYDGEQVDIQLTILLFEAVLAHLSDAQ